MFALLRSDRRQPGPRREDPSSIEHVLPDRSATRTLVGLSLEPAAWQPGAWQPGAWQPAMAQSWCFYVGGCSGKPPGPNGDSADPSLQSPKPPKTTKNVVLPCVFAQNDIRPTSDRHQTFYRKTSDRHQTDIRHSG